MNNVIKLKILGISSKILQELVVSTLALKLSDHTWFETQIFYHYCWPHLKTVQLACVGCKAFIRHLVETTR